MTNTYTKQLAALEVSANAVSMELTADWLQGRTGFGGWLAGLAVQAMRGVLGDEPPLRSLQANFVAPVPAGKVTAVAEILRQGKSVTQMEARVFVEGKVAFVAIGIFGASRPTAVVQRAAAPSAGRMPDETQDWPYVEGFTPAYTRNFRMRWSDGGTPYTGATHASAQIHVRPWGDVVSSEAYLVCLADAIPPSALALLSKPAMVSTINWTVELIAMPNAEEAAGWFRFDTTLTVADEGYAWQNAYIWSSQGRLLALSRQCVAIFA